jgi:hypothetical protein
MDRFGREARIVEPGLPKSVATSGDFALGEETSDDRQSFFRFEMPLLEDDWSQSSEPFLLSLLVVGVFGLHRNERSSVQVDC